MNFLKSLFSAGSGQSNDAYYIYVKPKMCQEIVEVRINMKNDLSPTDDYQGYWVRKVASAIRCPFQSEITLHFDKSRKLLNREIENGEFATKEEYIAFVGN
ncbi:MAG: hypothetical protein Phog2KO_32630 [Phototrophicaceae bacterium]